MTAALHSSAALTVTVYGQPAPQGSKRAFVHRHTGRPVVVEQSKRVKPWREAVKHAAIDAIADHDRTSHTYTRISGPVLLELVLTFTRPASHYRTGRNAHLLRDNAPAWPTGRNVGDVEKHTRAVCDALTDSGAWTDDALVVDLHVIKTFPGSHPDALHIPGAVIRIYRKSA